MLQTALEAAGCAVRTAPADAAAAMAREWQPDVVLLDVTNDEKLMTAIATLHTEPEVLPLAVTERRTIEAALQRTNHDVPRAAALLEINPSTIYRKLQAWRAGEA